MSKYYGLIGLLVLVSACLSTLVIGVAVAMRNSQPVEIVVTCPGEDTCSVPVLPKGWHADYRHNEWHITEGK